MGSILLGYSPRESSRSACSSGARCLGLASAKAAKMRNLIVEDAPHVSFDVVTETLA